MNQRPLHDVDGQRAKQRQPDRDLFEFVRQGIFQNAPLVQPAGLMLTGHGPLCRKIAFRCRTELGMKFSRDLGHRGANLLRQIGTLSLELAFDVVGGLGDQLLEHVPRDFLPKPDVLGENGIGLRPLDHLQEAEIGEAGAVIGRDRLHDFAIPARHQFVGDFDGKRISLGDRQQVGLALGSDIVDQRLGIEPPGKLQHRARNVDRVVESEHLDDLEGSVVGVSQPLGELGAGCMLDFLSQPSDHLAEDPDLIFRVASLDQYVGGVPQRALTTLGRSPRNRLVQFFQKEMTGFRHRAIHDATGIYGHH